MIKIQLSTFAFLIGVMMWGSNSFSVFAQSPKGTATHAVSPTTAKETIPPDHDVRVLKDKIATKVAQLQQKNKTVLSGTIISIEKNQLVLETSDGKNIKMTLDELTTSVKIISNDTYKSGKFDSLKKNLYVIISGIQIEDIFTPDVVYISSHYVIISGRIVDLNKEQFTLDVLTTNEETYTFDIESKTKQQTFDSATGKLKKGGFNQMKIGDTVLLAYVSPEDKKSKRATAIRTTVIPQDFFIIK